MSYWMPVPKMDFPGVAELIQRYQERAGEEKVDELGFYVVPLADAQLQVLEQAVQAIGTLDAKRRHQYIHEQQGAGCSFAGFIRIRKTDLSL